MVRVPPLRSLPSLLSLQDSTGWNNPILLNIRLKCRSENLELCQ